MSSRRWFVIVWIFACIALVLPLFAGRLLPILDLPNHLALVRGWLSFDDPQFHIADNYLLRVRLVPYVLFYAVCRALALVVGLELAGKLCLALYLVAFVHGVLALAVAARRSPWLAFVAFPLAYGPAYTYGFVNYLFGHALLWFALACAVRWLDVRRPVWLVGVALFTMLTWTSHVLAWGYLGIALVGLVVHTMINQRHRRGLLACLGLTVAALPSLALFAYAYVQERHEKAYFQDSRKFSFLYRPLVDLAGELPRWILECVPGNLDRLALALCLFSVAAIWMTAQRDPADVAPIGRLRAIALAWLIAYLLLPESLYAPTRIFFIAQRVPVLFAAALLIATPRPPRKLWLAPLVIAAFVLPPKLWSLYADFNARNRDFLALSDELPLGAKTLVLLRHRLGREPNLLTADDPSASVPVYWHFTSWPMVVRGGVSPHLFNQGIPIRPRTTLAAPPESKQRYFDLRTAPGYDYYLVHQPADPMTVPVEKIAQQGAWILYKKRPVQ